MRRSALPLAALGLSAFLAAACGSSDGDSSAPGASSGSAGVAGSGSAGKGTSGSGTAGKGTSGSGTAGSGTSGSGTAGTGTAGSGTSGSGTAGKGTAGTGTAGSGTAGSGTAGSGTAGTGTAGSGTSGSGTSTGTGIFEKIHGWNKDVSGLQPSSKSDAIIASLINMGGWGNGNKLQTDYSLIVLRANAQTPRRMVQAAPDYCYGGGPDCEPTPYEMPIPTNGNTEGSNDYGCDTADNDCHILVVEEDEKKLYELYLATGDGTSFSAYGAFTWDLKKQYTEVLRGDQCTSADAAGLPMAALLPTADEVASGVVNHAIRFALPNPRMKKGVYVRPATHAGAPSSNDPDAPPYGVRFRLKQSFDETPYNASARVILKALKTYGMILSDGGNIALMFSDDRLSTAKWADMGITPQTFNSIGVSNFEVVDLGAEIPLTYDCVLAP